MHLWLMQEECKYPSWRCNAWYASGERHGDDRNQHYAAQFISEGLWRRPIFTALVRPLQASTLAGTAHWASSCRFLIWPWCALWWRTTITEQKTTLWASSLCLSQACEQVLVHAHTKHTFISSGYYHPHCGLLHSDNCNLSFQVIDMFTYWRQMAPVCPLQRFSSMSKWPAKEFPWRACQSALQWEKARRLDAHQKIAAFSDNKKGPLENLRRSEERKSLLPPAAPPVQNSSGPILHCDPLPGAVGGWVVGGLCHFPDVKLLAGF